MLVFCGFLVGLIVLLLLWVISLLACIRQYDKDNEYLTNENLNLIDEIVKNRKK